MVDVATGTAQATGPSEPVAPTGGVPVPVDSPTAAPTQQPTIAPSEVPSGGGAANAPDMGMAGDGTTPTQMPTVIPTVPVVSGDPVVDLSELVGWAGVAGRGRGATTGGDLAVPLEVTTAAEFAANAGRPGSSTQPPGPFNPANVIVVRGRLDARDIAANDAQIDEFFDIASNKTIVGADASATLVGHIRVDSKFNVIFANLNIVGFNCTDAPCEESDEADGNDALTISGGSDHVWVHHVNVSDGTDGNLDVTEASDYVTVSWSRFSYSSTGRDHRFSNLIGSSDDPDTDDANALRVTMHHNWWAENVVQRQPRVRFGQVHLFNNLYTSSGSDYAIGLGVDADIRIENNVFNNISEPLDVDSFSNAASVYTAVGNEGFNGNDGTAFTPPYTYSLDTVGSVSAAVMAGAGPQF